MIVRIKFIDGSTAEYDISMSCTLLDNLTNAIDKGKSLAAFWVNYNPVSEEVSLKDTCVTVINTRNIMSANILKF